MARAVILREVLKGVPYERQEHLMMEHARLWSSTILWWLIAKFFAVIVITTARKMKMNRSFESKVNIERRAFVAHRSDISR
jgi:hypothetical protein